ncbi:MAG: hypothetical protein LBU92_02490 [Prevotellaceae bacterium]|jgi:hypothetical protein|nr:hypothetical protein [Prevotellaceae bacterium]
MDNMQKDASKEVDLLELSGKMLGALGKCCGWLLQLLQVVFVFFLRKIWWFAACVLLVVAFSAATYKVQKASYSSMLVAKMNVLDNAFAISYINNLKASLSDIQLTQKIFNLPDTALAKQVKSIEAFWGVSYFHGGSTVDKVDFKWEHTSALALRDTMAATRVGDRFFVRASVYNGSVLAYLTKGLVENMCSLPYLQELNGIRKVQVNARVAELSRQIKVLDSLQHYEYFVKDAKTMKPSMMGQLMLLSEKEKTLLHNEIMRLSNERLALETDLQLNPNPITVIQNFETNLQPEVLFFSIAKRWLLVGFLLTLIAAIAWDNRKWLAEKSKGK